VAQRFGASDRNERTRRRKSSAGMITTRGVLTRRFASITTAVHAAIAASAAMLMATNGSRGHGSGLGGFSGAGSRLSSGFRTE
jgi:hypothetical protein